RVRLVVDDEHSHAVEPRFALSGAAGRRGPSLHRRAVDLRGNRELHRECRAESLSIAAGGDAAIMRFHELLRNRHSEPESAMHSAGGSARLTETLEHVGEEVRIHAGAGVLDLNLDVSV